MKIEITAYPLLIKKRLANDEIHAVKKLIEKAGMSGEIPRPIIGFKDFRTRTLTMIYVVGNVGNYRDFILNTIRKTHIEADFIDDKTAGEILDDIDANFLDYL